MNKMALLLPLIFGIFPLANATSYNYPSPDILNISNPHNDYYINLTNGISLTNIYNEYWSKDYIGVRFNSRDYFTDEFNFTWNIYNGSKCIINDTLGNCWKWDTFVTLYGTSIIPVGSGYEYGVNYTLWNYDERITVEWRLFNNGVNTLRNTQFLWKLSNINIGSDYSTDAYKDFTPHYDYLTPPILKSYSDVEGYFQLEDYNKSVGIKVWFNNSDNQIDIIGDGNYDKNVTLRINNEDISPSTWYKQIFYWDDPPICGGNCQYLAFILYTYNSTSYPFQAVDAMTGDFINASTLIVKDPSNCPVPPTSQCHIHIQDDTPDGSVGFNDIPVVNGAKDLELNCYSPYSSTGCEKGGDYATSTFYTFRLNCTRGANHIIQAKEDLNGQVTTPVYIQCKNNGNNPVLEYTNPTTSGTIEGSSISFNTSINDTDGTFYSHTSAYLDLNHSLLLNIPFDLRTDTTLEDNSSYHHPIYWSNLTYNNTYMFGNHTILDGHDFINITNNEDLKLNNSFTLELWYRNFDIPSGVFTTILDFGSNITNGVRVRRLSVGATQVIYFKICRQGVGCPAENSIVIKNGVFNHIVFVYNITNIIGYLDGVKQMPQVVGSPINVTYNQDGFYIGGDYDGASWSELASGEIDNVRFHNRVLTDDEVLASYNSYLYGYESSINNLLGRYNYSICAEDLNGNKVCGAETQVNLVSALSQKLRDNVFPVLLLFMLMLIVIGGRKNEKE